MNPWDLNTRPSLEFTVERSLGGLRIDSFLAKHLRNYTKWRLNRMVAAGLAEVNGLPAARTQRVFRGDMVRIRLAEPPDKLHEPESAELQILYEDPWLVIVNKPAGMVAHPVGEFQSGTLSNVLQQHFDQQTVSRGLLRPGIVHRLDRMTSGLMVVTKEQLSHRLLSDDIQAGRIRKSYLALVEGQVSPDEFAIELPVGLRPEGCSVLMSAGADAIRPRTARTQVTVLERRKRLTLVECRLDTGRNHQIRVHMAELGHPVVGDQFYGPHGEIRSEPRKEAAPPGSQRHALHAVRLEFSHPILRVPLRFVSKPPADILCLTEVSRL